MAALGARWVLPEEYRRYDSPDGRWVVVVYRRPLWRSMPGGGSDAPGYAQLQDRSGQVFAEVDAVMVGAVPDPRWSSSRVELKLLADWQLPADAP